MKRENKAEKRERPEKRSLLTQWPMEKRMRAAHRVLH